MRIGIDVDGVTQQFVHPYRMYRNKKHGTPFGKMPEPTIWNFCEEWDISRDEFVEDLTTGLEEKELFWRGPQIDFALDSICDLYRSGHEIVFVTARDFDGSNQGQMATEYWLNANGFPYHEVIVDSDKTRHNLQVLLDDSPYNVAAQLDKGLEAALFNAPYNKHLPEFNRVKMNWPEFVAYVKKLSK